MNQRIGIINKGSKSWPRLIRDSIRELEAEHDDQFNIVAMLPLRYSHTSHELTEALIVVESREGMDDDGDNF